MKNLIPSFSVLKINAAGYVSVILADYKRAIPDDRSLDP
jgi:hypothetical protein